MNQTKESVPNNLRGLLALGLIAGLVFSYLEIQTIWSPDQAWDTLLTPLGWLTVAVYIVLELLSLAMLMLSLWQPQRIQSLAEKWTTLRWPAAVVLAGLLAWIYLLSPWKAILTGPWTQFLVAAGLIRLLAWLFVPKRTQPFGWDELALTFAWFLAPRMGHEVRIVIHNPLLAKAGMAALWLAALAMLLIYEPVGERIRLAILGFRSRLGKWNPVLAALALVAPFAYRYIIGAGGYILYPNIRFAIVLAALWVAALLVCTEPGRLVSLETVGLSAGVLVLVSAFISLLFNVVSDPFSLSWSEGNRLYDYSLVFGQAVYHYSGVIPDPYNTPGRYSLWGVLFLWNGLPIWMHRLWNVFLLTLPSFLLAWVLTRKLSGGVLRSGVFLWISAFFIIIAPLHPPFMLVAAIVAAFAFSPSPVVRGASLVAASLYAGVSRWTWVVAPGAWGALTDLLLYYPTRKGNWFRRLLPTVAMTLLGAGPGLLLQLGYLQQFSSGDTLTSKQPLLWYRLWPNSTLGPGIVFLMAMMTGPLIALLVYLMRSHRWKLDIWQHLALWGALAGFLGAGLVISTKIGGGGDLHNLDMYIGTLTLVTVLGLYVLTGRRAESLAAEQAQGLGVKRWPAWALAMICLLAFQPAYQFTPFNPSAGYAQWLDYPTVQETSQALNEIRSAVSDASQHGEVLFMDQRQLLTFGYIRGVPFVPEYEKKYMMDQAMASNAAYFQPYYQDLSRKRFALILTEPLKVNIKKTGVFWEENDLWVTWVSAPTLCFYEPVLTDKATGIQLLAPRQNPSGCEKYLNSN